MAESKSKWTKGEKVCINEVGRRRKGLRKGDEVYKSGDSNAVSQRRREWRNEAEPACLDVSTALRRYDLCVEISL